jgi:NADH-quinone oxidoreductase subunit A
MTSISIVAYLALFISVGFLFLFVNLVVGRFLRPKSPNVEKLEVYECGEPTIGSSFVQFDLRFYVVALLFIIFDVEVAFFFPWATVFGKATHLMNPAVAKVTESAPLALSADAARIVNELGVRDPAAAVAADEQSISRAARQLAWTSFSDIAVFFAVLMVGFAYVWKRGDLDWVRAVGQRPEPAARAAAAPPPVVLEEHQAALAG